MIINHSIEQTVLFKSRKEGQDFMHDGGERRENVRMCFTQSDRDPNKGHIITVNSQSGAVSIGPIGEWRERTRMQADREDRIK
jgi:structural maintenance of chromosomes protein 6